MKEPELTESTRFDGDVPGEYSRLSLYAGWIGLFAASSFLYAATASRGAQWQDSGYITLRIVTGQMVNPLGLALSHPLHYWLGRLAIQFTALEPCLVITLVSGLAAAVAVANVYGCVVTLTGRTKAALFAAASLALANTFWQLATLVETYTLGAALFSAECWCLAAYARTGRKRALWGMCLLNGLGVANHLQAALTTPVLAAVLLHAVWKRRITWGHLFIGMWLWLFGALPYIVLIVAELIQSGDWYGTLLSALFGKAYAANVLNATASSRVLLVSIAFPLLNFPNLLLPAAVYGLFCGRRIDVPALARRFLLAALVVHAVFALRYNISDQQTFFLPLYVLLSILGGVGVAVISGRARDTLRKWLVAAGILLLLATPGTYLVITTIAREFEVLSRFPAKPYRDSYTYLMIPWSVAERSAERMSREAVEQAGPRGLIVTEDDMARFAIEYRVLRSGHDIEVAKTPGPGSDLTAEVTERVDEYARAGRPVVLVPLDRNEPVWEPPVGNWSRRGDLYVLDVSASSRPATSATASGGE